MKMDCFVLLVYYLVVAACSGKPFNERKQTVRDSKRVHHIRQKIVYDVTQFVKMAKAKQHKITAEMTSKCSACIFLVNYEKMRVKEDPSTIERLGEVVEEGCELFRLESPRICKGAYSIFGAEARSVLTQVDLSAESICGICLPYFCPDIPDSREVKNKSNWSISLPPPSRKLKSNTKLSKMPINVLKVLHLSDIHMDLKYKVGSNADCTEPLCCRTLDGGDKPSIIDPIEGETTKPRILNATQKAWKWGDYRKCDLPWWTVNNLLQQLSRKHTFDYIIWTGDIAAHDVWEQSQPGQLNLLYNVTQMLSMYFPDTLIFPAVGNHDSFPANNFPPASVHTELQYSATWLYKALWKAWGQWLPMHTRETIEAGGFYTTLVKPGYRIVSLNTNFCYTENWWLWLDPEDPNGMLEWFVRVLTSAEVAGEKVQVIGHVPPGRSPDCMETWSKNYFRIIERFQHQISAQFFGHTHYDEIQILYDQFGSAISTAYIAPSLTSYIYMMPTYRVYDIDGYHENTTWSVANHKTYRLDLEEANRVDTPNWILEYDACNTFDQFYLSTENWESLVSSWEKFIVDKNLTPVPKTLTSYAKFYMRHPYLPPPEGLYNQLHCHDRSCYQSLVCNIIKNKQSELCFPIKP